VEMLQLFTLLLPSRNLTVSVAMPKYRNIPQQQNNTMMSDHSGPHKC